LLARVKGGKKLAHTTWECKYHIVWIHGKFMNPLPAKALLKEFLKCYFSINILARKSF